MPIQWRWKNPANPMLVSEETKQAAIDEFIDLFEVNGLDASWLRDLKSLDFFLTLYDGNDPKSNESDQTFWDNGKLFVAMNAGKFSNFSPEMKTKLLHEFRHVWQNHQDTWKSKIGDGVNTKTDMDVEADTSISPAMKQR